MKQFLFFLTCAVVVVLLDGGPVLAKADLPTEGGPYKVLAADFTGDGVIDLAVSYYRAGVIAIEKGDGRGNFAHLAPARGASTARRRAAGRADRRGSSRPIARCRRRRRRTPRATAQRAPPAP